MKFGVHTGLQNTTIGELQSLWRRIEDLGFDWISIWDHFYAADGTGNPHCLEAVASHAALAATTSRVRCGSLVYSVGYRHPAVLANAMATLDQLVGRPRHARPRRRVAGRRSTTAYGIEFPPAGGPPAPGRGGDPVRPRPAHPGRHRTSTASTSRSRDARCEPKPVQARLPLWIGGGGEKVTLRIAARHADGWNVAVHLARGLRAARSRCSTGTATTRGRDPAEITRSVNVGDRVARRRPRGAVRQDRRVRAPGRAARAASARWSTGSARTATPAPSG